MKSSFHKTDPDIIETFYRELNLLTASSATDTASLKALWLDTSLGSIITVADDNALYHLEFANLPRVQRQIKRLRAKTKAQITIGRTPIIDSIAQEIEAYYHGTLTTFNTPLKPLGTPFQQHVWCELQKIPFGETRSYLNLAHAIHHPKAVRAVAQANAANFLAIIIPCHRVINHNGKLGGYAGGLDKKRWLLQHENSHL